MKVITIEGQTLTTLSAAIETFSIIADLDNYRIVIPPAPLWEWEQHTWTAIMTSSWDSTNISEIVIDNLRSHNIAISFRESIHKHIATSKLAESSAQRNNRSNTIKYYDHWYELAEQKVQHKTQSKAIPYNPTENNNKLVPSTKKNNHPSYAQALSTNQIDFSQISKLVGKLEENSNLVSKLISENQTMSTKVNELSETVLHLQRSNKAVLDQEDRRDSWIQDLVLNTLDTKLSYVLNQHKGSSETGSPPTSKPRHHD